MSEIRLSKRLLYKGVSSNGSWSFEQLKVLNIIPLKGWKDTVHLITVPYDTYKKFLSLKDKHIKKPSKKHSSESSTHQMLPLSHYLKFQTLEEILSECPFDLNSLADSEADEWMKKPIKIIKEEKTHPWIDNLLSP